MKCRQIHDKYSNINQLEQMKQKKNHCPWIERIIIKKNNIMSMPKAKARLQEEQNRKHYKDERSLQELTGEQKMHHVRYSGL